MKIHPGSIFRVHIPASTLIEDDRPTDVQRLPKQLSYVQLLASGADWECGLRHERCFIAGDNSTHTSILARVLVMTHYACLPSQQWMGVVLDLQLDLFNFCLEGTYLWNQPPATCAGLVQRLRKLKLFLSRVYRSFQPPTHPLEGS